MFRRILVPLDGSPGAERALPVAASLLRQRHGSVILLHLVTPEISFKSAAPQPQTGVHSGASTGKSERDGTLRDAKEVDRRIEAVEQAMTEAATYLAFLPARYADDLAGLTTEMHLAFGSPSPTLPSAAHLAPIDLIVLCRSQEAGSAQWELESVARQVTRHSPVPLLILNEHEQDMPMLDGTRALRVVVPLDGSLFAEAALEPALKLLSQGAAAGQRELCLLHVVDLFAGDGTGDEEAHMSPYTTIQARQTAVRYLQMIASRLRGRADYEPDVRVSSLVTSGVDIASAILGQKEHAAERGPDEAGEEPTTATTLIALATHGHEGAQRSPLGNVADRLLNATTSPMMTVYP
jgi:nucleotide-binding universal stress UspA family protein